MYQKAIILALIINLSLFFQLSGQQYGFRNYSLEQGLPQTEVNAMLQDSRSNIWIGTNGGGLSRFNGIRFQTYTSRDGLSNNMVWALFEDSKGQIWIGASNAVTRYDGITFRNYTEGELAFLRTYNVFHEDAEGDIWIVSFDEQFGGRLLRMENDSLIDHTSSFTALSGNNTITAAYSSPAQNTLYLITSNGLYEFRDKKLFYSQINDFNEFEGAVIIPVFYDHTGKLWLMRINQVNLRDLFTIKKGDQPELFKTPQTLWWQGITGLYCDQNDRLWVSNLGSGIVMIQLSSGEVLQFDQGNGLPNDFVINFLEDHEGNIWMGTRGGGIIQYSRKSFIAYNFDNIIHGDVVRAIFQDSDRNYWFGLSSAGIVKYDGKRFTSFSKENYPGLVNVRDILELQNGTLLILTLNGLYSYDGQRLFSVNRQFGFDNAFQFSDALIDDDTLWLATRGNGVFKWTDRNTEQLSISDGSLPSNQVHSLYRDYSGNIWICTNNGLSRYKNGDIQTYTTENGLNGSIILQITQDHSGNYWIATFSGGINILKDNHFSYLTSENGLSSDIIYSILTDHEGNIWAGTQNGVIKIFIDSASSITGIQHFGIQDGFTGIENNGAANHIDREGNLWFGTVKGAMKYNLDIVRPNLVAPVVQITEIRMFFRHVDWEKPAYDKFRSTIEPWIRLPGKLSLPADSNHLTFIFEALSFVSSEKIRYQWKLDGLDKEWSPVTPGTEAVYPKIPPGRYVFQVRAMNNDGVWSESSSFPFEILPPWWNTVWFYIVAGTFILFTFGIILQLRIRITEKKKKELEEMVRSKTLEVVNKNQLLENQNEEINQQKLELEKANENLIELNNEKNNLIGILAHDLRNPLTSSLSVASGMVTNSANLNDDTKAGIGFLVMTLTRMNEMISKILDIRMIEQKMINLTCEKLDFNTVLNDVYSNFRSHAESKKIKLHLESKCVFGIADRNYLIQVFENLLSNAIKFSPPNRNIWTRLEDQNGEIRISFKDEGPGLNQEDIKKLFKPFQRLSAHPTAGEKSTGLGLSIVKKYVEIMGGRVWCESDPGKGATFILTFPKIQ